MSDNAKDIRSILVWLILALGVIFLLAAVVLLESGHTFWSGFTMSLSGSAVVSAILAFLGNRYGDNMTGALAGGLEGMRQVLGDRSFVLHNTERSRLKGTYDAMYNGADKIKICGVSLKAVIDYICEEKKCPDNWVRRLAERNDVEVKIIIPDPDSNYVALLDKNSENGSPLLSGRIRRGIAKLTDLAERYKAADGKLKGFPPLAGGSSITVFATHNTINFSITHAENTKGTATDDDVMLFGLLLNKDEGPIYRVYKNLQTRQHYMILKYFDMLIDPPRKIFVWDEDGIRCS